MTRAVEEQIVENLSGYKAPTVLSFTSSEYRRLLPSTYLEGSTNQSIAGHY